jgi:hypothetical protein
MSMLHEMPPEWLREPRNGHLVGCIAGIRLTLYSIEETVEQTVRSGKPASIAYYLGALQRDLDKIKELYRHDVDKFEEVYPGLLARESQRHIDEMLAEIAPAPKAAPAHEQGRLEMVAVESAIMVVSRRVEEPPTAS